jgi:aryl-alcohol dehydrogenase-like predicted oxidoreductase
MCSVKRLAIGTVQFGLPYGVANQTGQVSHEEASTILDTAWTAGIDTLDTAIAYGESEKVLGDIGVEQWNVISKLPAVPEESENISSWIQKSVNETLNRLGMPKLRGLMLHQPQQLLGMHGDEIYKTLIKLKKLKKVEKIGISIYSPDELDVIWPKFQFDLVQGPFNILDRRLYTSGWLTKLNNLGCEVHVRSIFLQGLLLMDDTKRRNLFKRWGPLWELYNNWLHEHATKPLEACLSFVGSYSGIDRVVIGVDGLDQLQEIITAVNVPTTIPPNTLICDDLDLINPSRWDMV